MRRLVSGLSAVGLVAATALLGTSPASAAAPVAWPPPPSAPGQFDFIHYGEGHHNEDGGPVVNGEIFRQTNLYGAAFLAFSSDMATTGSVSELQSFENLIDEGYSPLCPKAPDVVPCSTPLQVPWFHSPGNHDRLPVAGPGGVFSYRNDPYRDIFADNAWGQGGLPAGFTGSIPAGIVGAATHYWVDYGNVRLIVLDNSCHSISTCDALSQVEERTCPGSSCQRVGQNPPVGPGHDDRSQFEFLADSALDAQADGKLAFVMMHEPTRDPRYPLNVDPISANHTMNKGLSGDNQTLEAIAAATGVDGVLLGHIKGNALYEAAEVPYYIDGGGGGEPYSRTATDIGTDWGYYYGYRLFRVGPGAIVGTWLVPLADSIELRSGGNVVSGLVEISVGQQIDFDAIAVQPRCSTPGVCSNQEIRVELRPPNPQPGFESSVPSLAYVWHTSNPSVLAPVGSRTEPGFDFATMSAEGVFEGVAAGTATVTVVTGWESATIQVNVV